MVSVATEAGVGGALLKSALEGLEAELVLA